jgi:hypothetical protein
MKIMRRPSLTGDDGRPIRSQTQLDLFDKYGTDPERLRYVDIHMPDGFDVERYGEPIIERVEYAKKFLPDDFNSRKLTFDDNGNPSIVRFKYNPHLSDMYDTSGKSVKSFYTSDGGKNIVNTFYWAFDLRGRLKQETSPPRPYRGHEIPYVKEDIESLGNNEFVSHFKYVADKKTRASTQRKFKIESASTSFLSDHPDFDRGDIRVFVLKFIDGGWRAYANNDPTALDRKSKKKPSPTKRCLCKPKPKTPVVKKRVVKKVKK